MQILVLLLLAVYALCVYGICPDAVSILPCSCNDNSSMVICDGLTDEDVLRSVMVAARKKPIAGIELHSASLLYLPEDAFEGSGIQRLEISNSSILSLSDSEAALRGLEYSLTALIVHKCHYASAWEWSQLRSLQKLAILEIRDSKLLDLWEDDLASLSHLPLTEINLKRNELDILPFRAFAAFKELTRITLSGNHLHHIPRSAFPMPAKKLVSLDLKHNKIKILNVNFFEEMPALKFLYLGGNSLKTLDERTFQPIWKQMHLLDVHDSKIPCDCDLLWITKKKSHLRLIVGSCLSPITQQKKHLTHIKATDIDC